MHKLRRWAAAPIVVVAVMLIGQSTAWADSHSVDVDVYRTATGECTHAHGYINNTTARPHIDSYSKATVYAAPYQTPCYWGETLGRWQIAVREDLYHWDGAAWNLCNAGPWIYNDSSSSSTHTGWNFWWPCGGGYYYMEVGAYIQNNGWLGGWTGTTYVYV